MTSPGLSTTAYKIQRDEETPAAHSAGIPFVVLGGLSLGFEGNTETIEDEEITNTRGLVDATPVDRLASGQTSHVLRYGVYDAIWVLALQPDDGAADSAPHTMGVFIADPDPVKGGALVMPPARNIGAPATAIANPTNGLAVTSTTLTRSDTGGSWIEDGIVVGQGITLSNSEVGANNGVETVTAVTDTVLTFGGASFDITGSPDTQMILTPVQITYTITPATGTIAGPTGSGIEDFIEVGQWAYFENISDAPMGAETSDLERVAFKVLSKGTDSLVVQFLIPPTSGTWDGDLVRASQITDGSASYSATVEQLKDRSQTDANKRYEVGTNMKIGTIGVGLQRKQAVTADIGWVGSDFDPKYYHPGNGSPPTGWAAVPSAGNYVLHPNASNPSMAPIYNRGFIWFGDKTEVVKPGASVGFKSRSVRVALDNQIEPDGNLFEAVSSSIESDDVRARVSIEALFSVAAHGILVANKDWVDAEMAIAIPDGPNGNMYIIDFPAGRIATATASIPTKGNKTVVNAEFIARIATNEPKYYDPTGTNPADLGVSMRVVKVPAPA